MFAHVAALADHLQNRLLEAGFSLFSPLDPARRGPQVAVHVERPEACAAFLASRGVVVSPRGEVVRLSLHYYNNDEDLDRAVTGLLLYREQAGGRA